mmetsp:Transcript_7886/g.48770  ORF Transcript_7886/g.48770 Transcript_7886/m.48770 type:complete len:186 (-) Transcript_7886:143-700(-)
MEDSSDEDLFAQGDVQGMEEQRHGAGVDDSVHGVDADPNARDDSVAKDDVAVSQTAQDDQAIAPARGSDHVLAWKQQNRMDLEERMKQEQEKKRERIEAAKSYLQAQIEEREKMLQSRHEAIAERDQERLRQLAEEEEKSKGEEVWQVICNRIDFKKAQSMNRRDLSKFRSVLLKKKNHMLTLTS